MNSSMTKKVGSVFTDSLLEVVSKISGFSLTVTSSDPDNKFNNIIGVMNLSGQNNGTIFVSANTDDMRTLCSYIIGVSKDKVTKEDIDDALCELVNMTAGNVKLRLGNMGYSFMLSSPFAINGENISIVTKQKLQVFSSRLENEEISIKLKVIFTV